MNKPNLHSMKGLKDTVDIVKGYFGSIGSALHKRVHGTKTEKEVVTLKDITIKYNPYVPDAVFLANGAELPANDQLQKYRGHFFQDFVDELPGVLAGRFDDDISITLYGSEGDFYDLKSACDAAEKKDGNSSVRFELTHKPTREIKVDDLKALFEQSQQMPFDDLKRPEVRTAFEAAFNDELDINVVATMSAGKSTLINALLGEKLMPSQNNACTAKIVRIKDSDRESGFSAEVYGRVSPDSSEEPEKIRDIPFLSDKEMKVLNGDDNVGEVHITGDIPFVKDADTKLVLIDTPGVDNALDTNHREVTSRALSASSKTLVIFVMDATHIHSDKEDELLKEISDSMKKGSEEKGKQARDRFLFVINKIDLYKKGEDSVADTISMTVAYLKKYGIENPRIFPVSALAALLARKYQKARSNDEREGILEDGDLRNIAGKLKRSEDLHLEQYSDVPESVKKEIRAELIEALNKSDADDALCAAALVHSGIRNLEEVINLYVTKYCRPQKIKNAVDELTRNFDLVSELNSAMSAVTSADSDIEKLNEAIGQLNKTLDHNNIDRHESFKRRIDDLKLDTGLAGKLASKCGDVSAKLNKQIERRSGSKTKISEREAMDIAKDLKFCIDVLGGSFVEYVDDLLQHDIKDKACALLNEYLNSLNELSEIVKPGGLNLNLASFAMGELERVDISSAVSGATHVDRSVRYVDRTREVTKHVGGFWRAVNPYRWIWPDYKETETYKQQVVDEERYVTLQELIDKIIKPFDSGLASVRKMIVDFAAEATVNIKEFFKAKFAEVDSFLQSKLKELEEATKSRADSEKARAKAMELKSCLDEFDAKFKLVSDIYGGLSA